MGVIYEALRQPEAVFRPGDRNNNGHGRGKNSGHRNFLGEGRNNKKRMEGTKNTMDDYGFDESTVKMKNVTTHDQMKQQLNVI